MFKTRFLGGIIIVLSLVVMTESAYYIGISRQQLGKNVSAILPTKSPSAENSWEEYMKNNMTTLRESPIIVNASWEHYLSTKSPAKALFMETAREFKIKSVEDNITNVSKSFDKFKAITYRVRIIVFLNDGSLYSFFFTDKDIENLKIFKKTNNISIQQKLSDIKTDDIVLLTRKIDVLQKNTPLIEGSIEILR